MFNWSALEISLVVPLILLLIWCLNQWKNRKLLRLARSLPTIRPTLPVFGHLVFSAIRHRMNVRAIYKESSVDIPLEAAMKDVSNFCLWFGPMPFIMTQNPEDIKVILTSSKTLEKTYILEYTKFVIGDSLLTASANIWRPTRRHIQPVFHSRNLEQLLPTFNYQSKNLVKRLAKLRGNSCQEVLHAIYPLSTLNALDLVFGPKFNLHENNVDIKQIINFVLRTFHLWTVRILYFWLHHEKLFRLLYWGPVACLKKEGAVLMDTAKKELQQQMKLQTKEDNTNSFGEIQRLTMTDAFAQLILLNPKFTEEHFQHNVCTIMAGGIDTTALTLSTCFLMLAMHPKVQEKAFEEIESVYRSLNEDLYIADVKDLTYTEQVLKETMRLFPTFPTVSRKVSRDIKLSFGVLPAGSIVGMSIFGVHMNPRFYPDPLKFNPDHFTIENISKRPPFAYIPFSAGPRNCIGKDYAILSMKTTLAHVLREYYLSTDLVFSDIQLTMNVELTITNGFPVRFEKR